MGYDMRPASWGKTSDKVSAKLKSCACGQQPVAGTDTAGMWSAQCYGCSSVFLGADMLGVETWQELVREWNGRNVERK